MLVYELSSDACATPTGTRAQRDAEDGRAGASEVEAEDSRSGRAGQSPRSLTPAAERPTLHEAARTLSPASNRIERAAILLPNARGPGAHEPADEAEYYLRPYGFARVSPIKFGELCRGAGAGAGVAFVPVRVSPSDHNPFPPSP